MRLCQGILEVTSTKLRLRYTAYAGIITGFGGLLHCKYFHGDSWELFFPLWHIISKNKIKNPRASLNHFLAYLHTVLNSLWRQFYKNYNIIITFASDFCQVVSWNTVFISKWDRFVTSFLLFFIFFFCFLSVCDHGLPDFQHQAIYHRFRSTI